MKRIFIILSLFSAINIAAQDNKRKAEPSQNEPVAKRQKLDESSQSTNTDLFYDIAKPGIESIMLGAHPVMDELNLPANSIKYNERSSACFSGDGKYLAIGQGGDLFRYEIDLFDYQDKYNPKLLSRSAVFSAADGILSKFSKDGKYILMNNPFGICELISSQDLNQIDFSAKKVAFSKDEEWAAFVEMNTVGILDIKNRKIISTIDFNDKIAYPEEIGISECGNVAFVSGYHVGGDRAVFIIDISDKENPKILSKLNDFKINATNGNSVKIKIKNNMMFTGTSSWEGRQFFWDISNPTAPKKMWQSDQRIFYPQLEFYENGKFFYDSVEEIYFVDTNLVSKINYDEGRVELFTPCGRYMLDLENKKVADLNKSWIFNDLTEDQKSFILNANAWLEYKGFKEFVEGYGYVLKSMSPIFKAHLAKYFALKYFRKKYMITDLVALVGGYVGNNLTEQEEEEINGFKLINEFDQSEKNKK